MPAAFFGQEVSEEFMKAAVHTVELDHPDANKSVVQFLTEILSFTKRMNFATSDDSVKKLILTYGEELLYQCLQASIFTLSASLRYDVANLIKILVQLDSAVSFIPFTGFICFLELVWLVGFGNFSTAKGFWIECHN